jgi:hypothetical protein
MRAGCLVEEEMGDEKIWDEKIMESAARLRGACDDARRLR